MLGDASLDAMVSDRKMQLALQRLVEIMGEAASRVSEKARRQHRLRYGDGKWDKDRFAAEAHVLFRQGQDPAYLRQILQEPTLFQSSIGSVVP